MCYMEIFGVEVVSNVKRVLIYLVEEIEFSLLTVKSFRRHVQLAKNVNNSGP
jgi:hypothetical protein